MTSMKDDPRLTTYVLGEMEPEDSKAFERELANDPDAQKEMEDIRVTAEALQQDLAAESVPELTMEQREMIQRYALAGRVRKPRVWRRSLLRFIPIAAAAGFAIFLVLREPPSTPRPVPVLRPALPEARMRSSQKRKSVLKDVVKMQSAEQSGEESAKPLLAAQGSTARAMKSLKPASVDEVHGARGAKVQQVTRKAFAMASAQSVRHDAVGKGRREKTRRAPEKRTPQPMLVASMDRAGGEGGDQMGEESFVPVSDPTMRSIFSIDVDTASYALVRTQLRNGKLPSSEAVHIEELINYFSYSYPEPRGDVPFSVTMDQAVCPWDPKLRLVRIGVRGRAADYDRRGMANPDSKQVVRETVAEPLGGILKTIAKDVDIQVVFNPRHVAAYRLVGYANRTLGRRYLNTGSKDAREVRAGHTVTAFYEILPAVEGGELLAREDAAALQVQEKTFDKAALASEVLIVRLRYSEPGGNTSMVIETPLHKQDDEDWHRADSDFQFGAAVAAFGMILRGTEQRGQATLALVEELALPGTVGRKDARRTEFLDLVRKARAIDPRR
ncbi:MAG: von Willebrand factor type A domain-containing protein [Lentisphaeria bacterium]|nr:von Willebrand factor type A domain-containing protein [Lentisphaeria bacterium]